MSTKLSSAYKTIGEVVKILNNVEPKEIKINAHTLRFWETKFAQIKPIKRGGQRRYYRPIEILILRQIRSLLYDEGNIFKKEFLRYVVAEKAEFTIFSNPFPIVFSL